MTGQDILGNLDGLARKAYTAYSNNDYKTYDTTRKEIQRFRDDHGDVLSRMERLSSAPAVREVFGNVGAAASSSYLDSMVQAGIQSGVLKPMSGPNLNSFFRDPDQNATLDSLDERGLEGLDYAASRYSSTLKSKHADQYGGSLLSQLDSVVRDFAATEAGAAMRSAYQLDAKELSLGKLRDYAAVKDPVNYGDRDTSMMKLDFLQEGTADTREAITVRRFAEILRDPNQSPEVIQQLQGMLDEMPPAERAKFVRTPLFSKYLSGVLQTAPSRMEGQSYVDASGNVVVGARKPLLSRAKEAVLEAVSFGSYDVSDMRRAAATGAKHLSPDDSVVFAMSDEGLRGAAADAKGLPGLYGYFAGFLTSLATSAAGSMNAFKDKYITSDRELDFGRQQAEAVLSKSAKNIKSAVVSRKTVDLLDIYRQTAALRTLNRVYTAAGLSDADKLKAFDKLKSRIRLGDLRAAMAAGIIKEDDIPALLNAGSVKESAGQPPPARGNVTADKWPKVE